MEIIGYLDKKKPSAGIIGATEVRRRIMASGKCLAFPKSPGKWKAKALSQFGVAPVYQGDIPEFDKQTQRLVRATPVKVKTRWFQHYEVKERFTTLDDLRAHLKSQAKRYCNDTWRNAVVMVDGVPYKTDEKGLALMQTTTYYNRRIRHIVAGNKVYSRTPEQLREAKQACDEFVQACFDHLAALFEAIDKSDEPQSIDILNGWPDPSAAIDS